jgi:hypothetical protein
MIRHLVAGLAASSIAAAGLASGALAQQQQPPSPELVRDIQSRLFELSYKVWPDGNWDERTQAAIRSWHQVTHRPLSNVMSDDDVAYLRTASPYKSWGGVIYDAKGRYRLFTQGATRRDVIDREIGYCKGNFEPNRCQLDLLLETTMADSCTAVSHADWKDANGNHATSSTARRADIKSASDGAISECAKTAPQDSCKLLAAVCADGSS